MSYPKQVWLTLLLWFSLAGAGAAERLFAVVPQLTVTQSYENWQPFVSHLSAVVGTPYRLKVYASFAEFESDFQKGVPDLVYYNPYRQVIGHQAQGYLPLVRDSQDLLTGILIVGADSPYRQVGDLQGGEIAFPAPNAFAASLYLRALLTERERLRFSPNYAHSHSNAYRLVVTGKALAVGGVRRTLEQQPESARTDLRVVYETPPHAPHPIAVHPRVPRGERERITAALLDMVKTPTGRALLATVQMQRPVRADYRRDYAGLEGLGLQRFYLANE